MQTILNLLDKLQQPFVFLAYFTLLMGILSLWIKKTPLLWGSFMVVSLIFAKKSGIINWIAFAPLAAMFAAVWVYSGSKGLLRTFSFLATLALGIALCSHSFSGFHNAALLQSHISPDAVAYTLWVNYDTAFAGLILVTVAIPLIHSKKQWKGVCAIALLWSILCVVLLQTLAVQFHLIHWDPKLPPMFFAWFLINLFFVTIPEEALFRGVLQKQLEEWLGNSWLRQSLSILLTSALFTAMHLAWIANGPFLGLVFLAGILYGAVYQYTKMIESSILTHFIVNSVHFFLFTYPILA